MYVTRIHFLLKRRRVPFIINVIKRRRSFRLSGVQHLKRRSFFCSLLWAFRRNPLSLADLRLSQVSSLPLLKPLKVALCGTFVLMKLQSRVIRSFSGSCGTVLQVSKNMVVFMGGRTTVIYTQDDRDCIPTFLRFTSSAFTFDASN